MTNKELVPGIILSRGFVWGGQLYTIRVNEIIHHCNYPVKSPFVKYCKQSICGGVSALPKPSTGTNLGSFLWWSWRGQLVYHSLSVVHSYQPTGHFSPTYFFWGPKSYPSAGWWFSPLGESAFFAPKNMWFLSPSWWNIRGHPFAGKKCTHHQSSGERTQSRNQLDAWFMDPMDPVSLNDLRKSEHGNFVDVFFKISMVQTEPLLVVLQ